jgi:hypothetical protein
MTPSDILRSIPGLRKILSDEGWGGEAFMIDSDGGKWHVTLKALPRHTTWIEEDDETAKDL